MPLDLCLRLTVFILRHFTALALSVRNNSRVRLLISHLVLVIVNLDIVRTEPANDTADVEVKDDDLLLTPTVVFGFSLNDKVWCMFLAPSIYTPS